MDNESEDTETAADHGVSSEAHGSPPSSSSETELTVSPNPTKEGSSQAESMPVALQQAHLHGVAYRVTDLSAFKANPDDFYEFTYRHTLKAMIEAVMDTESPLLADVLAQRIARAHGWLQTGPRIRERIDLHLRDYDTTDESSGIFLWKKGCIVDFLPYRPFVDEASRRNIAKIPLAELAWVAKDNPDLMDMPDPARELARLIGVERLAASARARLDEALLRARALNHSGE